MYLLHVNQKDLKLNRSKVSNIVNIYILFNVLDYLEYKGKDIKRICAQDFNNNSIFYKDLDDNKREVAKVHREISIEARAKEELR